MNAEARTAKLLAMRPVMEAFLKGEKVEVRHSPIAAWQHTASPAWDIDFEYRIKPKPFEGWMAVHKASGTASPVFGNKARVQKWVIDGFHPRDLDKWDIIFVRQVDNA